MASRADTQNGPDWRDVASALEAFQQDNGLVLRVQLTFCGTTKKPDLLMEVYSDMQLDDDGEVKKSVSVTSRFVRLNVKTVEAAILCLLHTADYAMVEEKYPYG